jgi:hypothetical protein
VSSIFYIYIFSASSLASSFSSVLLDFALPSDSSSADSPTILPCLFAAVNSRNARASWKNQCYPWQMAMEQTVLKRECERSTLPDPAKSEILEVLVVLG